MGLTDYVWKGVGQSILDTDKLCLAIDAHGKVYGDTLVAKAFPDETLHIKDAWRISDEIIRYNYWNMTAPCK